MILVCACVLDGVGRKREIESEIFYRPDPVEAGPAAAVQSSKIVNRDGERRRVWYRSPVRDARPGEHRARFAVLRVRRYGARVATGRRPVPRDSHRGASEATAVRAALGIG